MKFLNTGYLIEDDFDTLFWGSWLHQSRRTCHCVFFFCKMMASVTVTLFGSAEIPTSLLQRCYGYSGTLCFYMCTQWLRRFEKYLLQKQTVPFSLSVTAQAALLSDSRLKNVDITEVGGIAFHTLSIEGQLEKNKLVSGNQTEPRLTICFKIHRENIARTFAVLCIPMRQIISVRHSSCHTSMIDGFFAIPNCSND